MRLKGFACQCSLTLGSSRSYRFLSPKIIDPMSSVPEAENGFSRSQTLQLEILKESVFEKHGTDANLLEIFLKTPPGGQWPIFMLLYPKVAFLIDEIVDVRAATNVVANSHRFYYNFTEITTTTPSLTRILDCLIGGDIILCGDLVWHSVLWLPQHWH